MSEVAREIPRRARAAGNGASAPSAPHRDEPWVMRTYSGHSTAKASNELYRTNLAKGQTGLSIAFDLPTQIGYDPDAPEAAGEVGKVGRARGPPRAHGPAPRRHPGRVDEHVDDHQRHRRLAARPVRGQRRGPRRRPGGPGGHHAERHREGVPVPGHVHLPAGPEPAPHRRHHRLHRAHTCRAGTRSTSAATTCRRRGPPPPKSLPTRWPPPSGSSTPCATRARSPRRTSRRWSGGSPSS